MVRGQKLELLSVLDLEEHCAYPVHGHLPRAAVRVMLALLDEAMAIEQRPDTDVFVGNGHHACASMVEGLAERGLVLVSKLRRDAVALHRAAGPGPRPPAQV